MACGHDLQRAPAQGRLPVCGRSAAGRRQHAFFEHVPAYETLDPTLQSRIRDLRCVHDASRNSAGELRLGFSDNTDPRQTVGATHPLVSVHAVTGRACLLLGRRRNAYIAG